MSIEKDILQKRMKIENMKDQLKAKLYDAKQLEWAIANEEEELNLFEIKIHKEK